MAFFQNIFYNLVNNVFYSRFLLFIIQPFNDLEMFGERFPLVAGLFH